MIIREKNIPSSVLLLGWAGVWPFAGISAFIWLKHPESHASLEAALIAYGAIILSFMGGVHWGLAMKESTPANPPIRPLHLVLSVLPALIGWTATFLETANALAVLVIGFLALLTIDVFWASGNCAPVWYGKLRLLLTSAVVSCMGLVFLVKM